MRRSAVSTYCRPAADSSARASASRPATDSSARIGGQPWWNNWAWMRCCQARRSSISVQYNRPRVRISSTCAGGIHDSGNRPSNSSVRSSRASARSVLARFFGPRNAAISAGSPKCATHPRRGQLLDHIPPPGAALQRELRVPVRAVLAQPAPQRRPRRRTDLTPRAPSRRHPRNRT